MFADFTVPVPAVSGVSIKTIRGTSYVYFTYEYRYSHADKRTRPYGTSIGKMDPENSSRMYPNANYFKYFPDEDIPRLKEDQTRSLCLRIGTYAVVDRVIRDLHIRDIAETVFGKESGLFLDLMAYSLVTEDNAGQYYPEYAFNHPLFTPDMRLYSDTKVSSFLNEISRDQIIRFQNMWNEMADHTQKIYISYDSTNKNCQAGDLEMVEIGHPKDSQDKPVVNYSIAYDQTNQKPLFYEEYPGSIVDVAQLRAMLEKAKGYGYQHMGFILDRGYFSKGNIEFMDRNQYSFVMMVRGRRELVRNLIHQVKGTFEDKRSCAIRKYGLNGITVRARLYPADTKKRYFHIFYSDARKAAEREALEGRIDQYHRILDRQVMKPGRIDESFERYFDLIYSKKDEDREPILAAVMEKTDVIDEEVALCGYFVIITSEEMTAREALYLYKGRDAAEKLFRADKSYLGNRSLRVSSDEALSAKILVLFTALIVRNEIYKEIQESLGEKTCPNYMTVPAAIKELEKIEIVRQNDAAYRMDYALTARQKEILKALHMDGGHIRSTVRQINETLRTTVRNT